MQTNASKKEAGKISKADDNAHKADLFSLVMLNDAARIIAGIACGRLPCDTVAGAASAGSSPTRLAAAQLLSKVDGAKFRRLDDPKIRATIHPRDPIFTAAADALESMLVFLREYASATSVFQSLDVATRDKIVRLCGHGGVPVRLPIPPENAEFAKRAGDGAVHVSFLEACKRSPDSGPDFWARKHLRAVFYPTQELWRLYCEALANPDSQLAKDLISLSRSGSQVVGLRGYLPLHGAAYNSLVERDAGKKGTIGYVISSLKEAILAAERCAVEKAGFACGTSPREKSVTLLLGDLLRQLDHFDVMLLRQIVMILTHGWAPYIVESVNPEASLSHAQCIQRIEAGGELDSVRDEAVMDGRPVSQYSWRVYLGQVSALLRTSQPLLSGGSSAAMYEQRASHLRMRRATPGVEGTLSCFAIEPMHLHGGPPHPELPWPQRPWVPLLMAPPAPAVEPDSEAAPRLVPVTLPKPEEEDPALRNAFADLHRNAGVQDMVDFIINRELCPIVPPRISSFTCLMQPDTERFADEQTLFPDENTTSRQHRIDVALVKIGSVRSLAPAFLVARKEGHVNLPDFSEGKQRAAARALLSLTSEAEANEALHSASLVEFEDKLPWAAKAVAATFPALFADDKCASSFARAGMEIVNIFDKAIKRGEDVGPESLSSNAAKELAIKKQNEIMEGFAVVAAFDEDF